MPCTKWPEKYAPCWQTCAHRLLRPFPLLFRLLTACYPVAKRALSDGLFLHIGAFVMHLCGNTTKSTHMKATFLTIAICLLAIASQAQTAGSGASQSTSLTMANAIEITLQNGTPTVSMVFDDINDFANGVTSSTQTIRVRSNRKFNVRVRSQASRFTYAGSSATNPKMPVNPVLKLKVSDNNTGGTISGGYGNFKSMSTGGAKIINNAQPGGDNTFSIQYQATPGYTYPEGQYTVSIIYTATQA